MSVFRSESAVKLWATASTRAFGIAAHVVLGAASGLGAACSSSEGEPCKEQDDCSGSLVCCPRDRGPTSRGVCLTACRQTGGVFDAGMDAGPSNDAATDGGDDAGDAGQ